MPRVAESVQIIMYNTTKPLPGGLSSFNSGACCSFQNCAHRYPQTVTPRTRIPRQPYVMDEYRCVPHLGGGGKGGASCFARSNVADVDLKLCDSSKNNWEGNLERQPPPRTPPRRGLSVRFYQPPWISSQRRAPPPLGTPAFRLAIGLTDNLGLRNTTDHLKPCRQIRCSGSQLELQD